VISTAAPQKFKFKYGLRPAMRGDRMNYTNCDAKVVLKEIVGKFYKTQYDYR